jgi:hypothetical protein
MKGWNARIEDLLADPAANLSERYRAALKYKLDMFVPLSISLPILSPKKDHLAHAPSATPAKK